MTELWWSVAGFALVLSAALVLRTPARLLPADGPSVAVSLLPPLLLFGLVFGIAGRGLFAGGAVLVTAVGVVFADQVKRQELREPLVFADFAEMREVVRHPGLYLPFAGTLPVLLGAPAVAFLAIGLLAVEPVVPSWPLPSLAMLAIILAALLALPLLHRLVRAMPFSQDPETDARRYGLGPTLFAYALLARFERSARRDAVRRHREDAPAFRVDTVVLVQNESFFDMRRLDPALLPQGLPAFDACRSEALHAGRLAVPAWGANTVRTEFAVLTGIASTALGLDRFNPYFVFARAPLPSLAWRFRAAGFHTVCLHPFDRTFYGRHAVMPQLGFETFLGRETLCPGAVMDDPALADKILEMLTADERPLFVFAITMGNHGPWIAAPEAPRAAPLDIYLDNLRKADAMIARLRKGLASHKSRQSLLAFYGDHQPNLPAVNDRPELADGRTDYFIWSPLRRGGEQRDIAAELLPQLIVTDATHIRASVGLGSHAG